MPEEKTEQEEMDETVPETAEPDTDDSEDPEKVSIESGRITGTLFSPEAIIMLMIAVILDLISFLLLFVALDDFFIGDLIGIAFIGGWIYFRSQTIKATQGAAQRVGKAAKWASRMKWLRPLAIIAELIPYVGAAPSWTILVYAELQT